MTPAPHLMGLHGWALLEAYWTRIQATHPDPERRAKADRERGIAQEWGRRERKTP